MKEADESHCKQSVFKNSIEVEGVAKKKKCPHFCQEIPKNLLAKTRKRIRAMHSSKTLPKYKKGLKDL